MYNGGSGLKAVCANRVERSETRNKQQNRLDPEPPLYMRLLETRKVARNTKSCQKVTEQLVASSSMACMACTVRNLQSAWSAFWGYRVRVRQDQRTHSGVFCPPYYGPPASKDPKETPYPKQREFGWRVSGWRRGLYERRAERCAQTGIRCPRWQNAALDWGRLVDR